MNLLKNNLLAAALLLLLSSPWQQGALANSDDKITVFTSVAPVSFVVQQIGGTRIDVHSLIAPGRDPHTFSPNPRQVVALSQARIYFTVGMTFEHELTERLRAGNTPLEIIDCSIGIAKRPMAHDHHHQHHDVPGDPHVWLSIGALAQMAKNISASLGQVAPDSQQQFEENLGFFLERLDSLDSNVGLRLAPFKGRTFLVFHPSFGYFADSFGLIQEAVEIEGKTPSPRQLTEVIKLARAKEIKTIFVQPQFDKRAAQRMAQAIGGKVLTLDPLAADVLANIETMAEKIATALGK